MAEGTATRSPRRHRTICVPISEEAYPQLVNDPSEFRRTIDDCFRRRPELFPANFAHGYRLQDDRFWVKQEVPIRRVRLRDGTASSIRPSFLMPYLRARTEEVEGPLFLRTFGVPFWALAHVFGADPMFWYRRECGLGRFRVVGTTVRQAGLPEHLVADEHHQPLDGQELSSATTVGSGCCLGAEPAEAAGAEELKAAYGTFRDEAHEVTPEYAPETVSTDGWKGTQAAGTALFPTGVILLGFRHAWLKVRDRAKHWKAVFAEISRRVWEAYHAPDRRSFAHRLRRLRQGSLSHLTGVVLETVPEPVRPARSLVGRVPPPRRASHEQHARPDHARDEPLLRPGPTPARLACGVSVALPGVGVALERRALAPSDGAEEPRLAISGRAPQSASVRRLLAAKPVELRLP